MLERHLGGDISNHPTNADLGYKGALIANFDGSDAADKLLVDFGSLGIWRCEFDDFSWTQYSGMNPFYGLRTNYGNPALDEETWTFSSVGMWSMYQSGGSNAYYQLTGTHTDQDDFASANFTNSSTAEDVVADFASLGLWLYKSDFSGWVKVSSMSANRIKEVKFVGNPNYELLAQDNAGGLYYGNWNGSTMLWTLITNDAIGPGWCETFDEDGTDAGDEEVIIPLTAGGANKYDYSAGTYTIWIASTTPGWNINFMVKGDYYGKCYDSTLAVVFNSSSASGAPGLWLYNKAATWDESWVKISGVVPDGLY